VALSRQAARRYNGRVGTFKVRIEVGDVERSRFVPVQALVDTGATYTVLPRQLLEELAIVPHRRASFALADGRHVERDLGRAWIRLGAQEEYSLVVFGDDAMLGAVTLEEFLLAPDPVEQRLVPVPALMMRIAA
jgi:predicted aspartyl protease